jgi:cytoskeleton protein RodZ
MPNSPNAHIQSLGAHPTEPAASFNNDASAQGAQAALEQLHFADVPLPPVHTLTPLRDLRMQKGLSVEHIASALRLSASQIHALENHAWDKLPGAAYIKGFLRNYARHLGTDPQPYLDQYDAQYAGVNQSVDKQINAEPPLVLHKDPTALSSFNATAHREKSHQSLFTGLGLLILATLAFLLFWERAMWLPKLTAFTAPMVEWMGQRTASQPVLTSVPTSTVPAIAEPASAPPAVATTSTTDAAPSTALSVAAAPPAPALTTSGPVRALTFQIDKAVWLEVRDSANNVIYYGTKNAGTNETIKGSAPLKVVVGAADAIRLSVDGASLDVKQAAIGNVARLSIP